MCISYLYNMTFLGGGVHECHMTQCHNLHLEIDCNYKFWFTKFVSLHRGCRIIKGCIREVGLSFFAACYFKVK